MQSIFWRNTVILQFLEFWNSRKIQNHLFRILNFNSNSVSELNQLLCASLSRTPPPRIHYLSRKRDPGGTTTSCRDPWSFLSVVLICAPGSSSGSFSWKRREYLTHCSVLQRLSDTCCSRSGRSWSTAKTFDFEQRGFL